MTMVTQGATRPHMDDRPPPFVRPHRWRWAACSLPGLDALRVEIRANLTYAELRMVEGAFATVDALFVAMAPHVRAWNVGTIDPETGESRLVAPPATAGPGAFFQVPEAVTDWIRRCLVDDALDRAPNPLTDATPEER